MCEQASFDSNPKDGIASKDIESSKNGCPDREMMANVSRCLLEGKAKEYHSPRQ